MVCDSTEPSEATQAQDEAGLLKSRRHLLLDVRDETRRFTPG